MIDLYVYVSTCAYMYKWNIDTYTRGTIIGKRKKKTQNIRCSRDGRVGIFGKGAGGAGWVVLSAKRINENHNIILIY